MTRAGDLTRETLLGNPPTRVGPSTLGLVDPRDWPELGDLYAGNTSRVLTYLGDRRVAVGVDESSGRVTAYVCQRQERPLAPFRTVLSTSSRATAAQWLAGASLPLTPAQSA